jgi:hypothetical protein
MPTTRCSIALLCCLFATAAFGHAQTRKAGLWEMTTTMTWQQSPLPAGSPAASPNSPFAGGPKTTMICLTQEQIDRFGAIVPSSRTCQISNVVKSSNGMSADWLCTGMMSGKGSLESSWSEDGHAKGKVHFTGALQAGPASMPIEWTAVSTSVFKGADCGAVKPIALPGQ